MLSCRCYCIKHKYPTSSARVLSRGSGQERMCSGVDCIDFYLQAAHVLQLTNRPTEFPLCQLPQQQHHQHLHQQQHPSRQHPSKQHHEHHQRHPPERRRYQVCSDCCGCEDVIMTAQSRPAAEACAPMARQYHCREQCEAGLGSREESVRHFVAPEGVAQHTCAVEQCGTSLIDMARAKCCTQHCTDTCSHDASSADENFSSCSSSSSTISTSSSFSDCDASKNSIASSSCSGTAWQGQVNWSDMHDRPDAAELHNKLSSPNR